MTYWKFTVTRKARSVKTNGARFGDFEVNSGVFKATSYNDYVSRLVNRISEKLSASVGSVSSKQRSQSFPAISVNNAQIAALADGFIRNKLFNQTIDPIAEENWRVLKVTQVIDHIVAQISGMIVTAHEMSTVDSESEVIHISLSGVDRLTVRENYSLPLVKSIYERTPPE